jgi:hypothetical protein
LSLLIPFEERKDPKEKEIPFPQPSLVPSKSYGFNHSQGARRELNILVIPLNKKLKLKKANVKYKEHYKKFHYKESLLSILSKLIIFPQTSKHVLLPDYSNLTVQAVRTHSS